MKAQYRHAPAPSWSYEGTRRVVYGDEWAQFVPVCPNCGRFVKADETITRIGENGNIAPIPNATCHRCGRVNMPFEGYG